MKAYCTMQVVAFVKGTRTQPQCGFSYKVLSILNESKVNFEVVSALRPGVVKCIAPGEQDTGFPSMSGYATRRTLPCR